MQTVKSFLGLREAKGDVGVEIEVEGRQLPVQHQLSRNWRREEDGSLRGYENGEYVMRHPVRMEELQDVFDELKNSFEKSKAVVDNNYRAGVHVHINVQELTGLQLFNFITLFLIFEEPLVDFCDPTRRGNHFCLRACDAGYLSEILWRSAQDGDLKLLNTEDIRYSAMNLSSLFKYGSIEFRSLESTVDFERLMKWCKVLYRIREASKLFKDPKEIMYNISVGGYDHFTNRVFEDSSELIFQSPNWKEKVRRGILHAQDMAFSRNWGKVSLDIWKKDNGFL